MHAIWTHLTYWDAAWIVLAGAAAAWAPIAAAQAMLGGAVLLGHWLARRGHRQG